MLNRHLYLFMLSCSQRLESSVAQTGSPSLYIMLLCPRSDFAATWFLGNIEMSCRAKHACSKSVFAYREANQPSLPSLSHPTSPVEPQRHVLQLSAQSAPHPDLAPFLGPHLPKPGLLPHAAPQQASFGSGRSITSDRMAARYSPFTLCCQYVCCTVFSCD